MTDKIQAILRRYEEGLQELGSGTAQGDPARLSQLMKEEAQLAPVFACHKRIEEAETTERDSLEQEDRETLIALLDEGRRIKEEVDGR